MAVGALEAAILCRQCRLRIPEALPEVGEQRKRRAVGFDDLKSADFPSEPAEKRGNCRGKYPIYEASVLTDAQNEMSQLSSLPPQAPCNAPC
eukprot:scaffold3272_cov239-Pinguiococcus_pyrenoidosus.AAC.8